VDELIEKGIRFGKGLQLVNILRDVPADLRLGRCYIPQELLIPLGVQAADLLDASSEQRFRPAYDSLVTEAENHLKVAWSYVLDLPRRWIRLRLACALPVLIGVKTLNKLRAGNVLNPDMRIKVSRAEVKQILRASVFLYPLEGAWKKLPARVVRS
jgi:farnesyl-diphosphate farnesyltransferase